MLPKYKRGNKEKKKHDDDLEAEWSRLKGDYNCNEEST